MNTINYKLWLGFLLPILGIGSFFNSSNEKKLLTSSSALVSFDDYKSLVLQVEKQRAEKLITLDEFLAMSKEPNTIILDTRSKDRYDGKHIKGAKHLAFTDFTQQNLNRLIPNKNTRILIYCNNNFMGDQEFFASKVVLPKDQLAKAEEDPIMLALNIPTYINLVGYGYQNVYELNELVNISDPRIEFGGTSPEKISTRQRLIDTRLLKSRKENSFFNKN